MGDLVGSSFRWPRFFLSGLLFLPLRQVITSYLATSFISKQLFLYAVCVFSFFSWVHVCFYLFPGGFFPPFSEGSLEPLLGTG